MDPLLVYAAADLDTAGIALDRELPPAWLAHHLADVEASAVEPAKVVGRLSRSGTDDVVVRGDVHAALVLPCARCLGPAPVELHGELALLLRPGKVLPEPAVAIDPPARGGKAAKGPRAARTAVGGVKSSAAKSSAAAPTEEGVRGSSRGRPARGRTRTEGAGAASSKLPEYEFSSEEADHDLYDGETILLDGFVREALLLEVPNFPLCSEACPGIAPVPDSIGDAPPEAAAKASTGRAGSKGPLDAGTSESGISKLGEALRAALEARGSSPNGTSSNGSSSSGDAPPGKSRKR